MAYILFNGCIVFIDIISNVCCCFFFVFRVLLFVVFFFRFFFFFFFFFFFCFFLGGLCTIKPRKFDPRFFEILADSK